MKKCICVVQITFYFMAIIINGSVNCDFKVSVTVPSINLSSEGRSSFIQWKNIIPHLPPRSKNNLKHIELFNLKIKNEINNTNVNFNSDHYLKKFQKQSAELVNENNTELLTEVNNNQKFNNQTTNKTLLDWIQNVFTSTTTVPTPLFNPEDCPKCECGISNPPNRIVGGNEAKAYNYPWMTYLTYKGHFYCAASIINDRYLLTAAHCVDRFDKSQIKVRVGIHSRNATSNPFFSEYTVLDIIKHSGYSTYNYNNDIALVKVTGIIKFEGPIVPICLPEKGNTYAGLNGTVTGWGATVESGAISNNLQEVVVPIMSNAECRQTKYPSRRITDNMMCAGFIEGGKDSCQGDSGGPLHILDENKHKVVGIVSWGEGCAVPGYPGVYARVNRYITWIQRHTVDSCYC